MRQFYLFVIIGLITIYPCYAVDFIMNNSSNSVNCGASHNFYDSGGAGADYGDNESFTMTFSPNTTGRYINISFNNFTLSEGDVLSFYNGNSTSAPLIGTYTLDASPGTIAASNVDNIFVQSKATALSNLELFNALGQEITQKIKIYEGSDGIHTSDVQGLESGFYLLKMGLKMYKINKQ